MIKLQRRRDWASRLSAFVRARRLLAFEWGRNDCVLFAADAVEAIASVDLADQFRGSYDSAASAARLVAQLGGIEAIATGRLGAPRPGLLACVGDVCLVDIAGREALALCNGVDVLGPAASGISAMPLSAARLSWRVG